MGIYSYIRRLFTGFTTADYLAEERTYTIGPCGSEAFQASYVSSLRKGEKPTLLGTYGTEEQAKNAITNNLRLFAHSKGDRLLEDERARKIKPYEWPAPHIKHTDQAMDFANYVNAKREAWRNGR